MGAQWGAFCFTWRFSVATVGVRAQGVSVHGLRVRRRMKGSSLKVTLCRELHPAGL